MQSNPKLCMSINLILQFKMTDDAGPDSVAQPNQVEIPPNGDLANQQVSFFPLTLFGPN